MCKAKCCRFQVNLRVLRMWAKFEERLEREKWRSVGLGLQPVYVERSKGSVRGFGHGREDVWS